MFKKNKVEIKEKPSDPRAYQMPENPEELSRDSIEDYINAKRAEINWIFDSGVDLKDNEAYHKLVEEATELEDMINHPKDD